MGLDHKQFWVIDVEGNGGNPPEVVELAMVQVVGLEVTSAVRHWFIRPTMPITSHASRIHGLTDEDVRDAPYLSDIEDNLLVWLQDAAIAGHNVKVEFDILTRSLPGWVPAVAVDTLRLSRALVPGLTSYSLENVGAALGHTEEAARRSSQRHHSALFDATLTALVFVDLVGRALGKGRPDLIREADILRANEPRLL
jgi:DNA polymerase-3 subunit epsilon